MVLRLKTAGRYLQLVDARRDKRETIASVAVRGRTLRGIGRHAGQNYSGACYPGAARIADRSSDIAGSNGLRAGLWAESQKHPKNQKQR